MCNGFDNSSVRLLRGGWLAAEAVIVVLAVTLVGCAHQSALARPSPNPDHGTPTSRDLFTEGVAYAVRGDTLRAEHYLGAAMRAGYDADAVVSWLVRVCVASSRYRTALRHAEAHLRVDPSDWGLRLVVANIHDALGEFTVALRELERIVAERPHDALVHYRLGLLYRERFDDRVSFLHHFEHYLRLDPAGPHSAEVRAELAAHVADRSGPQRIPAAPAFEGSVQ